MKDFKNKSIQPHRAIAFFALFKHEQKMTCHLFSCVSHDLSHGYNEIRNIQLNISTENEQAGVIQYTRSASEG